MTDERTDQPRDDATEFEREAGGKSSGLIGEFWGYLKENKKWWLTPILIVLLLLGLLVLAGTGPLAPFIYTLF